MLEYTQKVLHNSQINRLLASIVASMVVLSAVANVEVRLPQGEVDVIVNQLKCDCNELLSDRTGQDALLRLLRMGEKEHLENGHFLPTALLQSNVHVLPFGNYSGACPPEMLIPRCKRHCTWGHTVVDAALLAPAVRTALHIRAPGA